MKNIFVALLVSMSSLVIVPAQAAEVQGIPLTKQNFICRKFDYYQLGGDRKVFQIAVRRQGRGTYSVMVTRFYEALQADHTFKRRDLKVDHLMAGLTCLHAPTLDPRVVTCSSDEAGTGLRYFNVALINRDNLMSAFSSRPGEIVHTQSLSGAVYGQNFQVEKDHLECELSAN